MALLSSNVRISEMIHEAILISDCATLNSKAEYRGYKMARLKVEEAPWEARNKVELERANEAKLDNKMLLIKNKVLAHRTQVKSQVRGNNNATFCKCKTC